jgi:hypothetical protein
VLKITPNISWFCRPEAWVGSIGFRFYKDVELKAMDSESQNQGAVRLRSHLEALGKLIQVVGRTQFLSIVGSRACFLLSSVGGSSQFILSAVYDNLQIVTMQPGKLNKGG